MCLCPSSCQPPPYAWAAAETSSVSSCLRLFLLAGAQEARGEDPQASRAPWCPGRDCGARRFQDAKQKRRQPVGAAEGPRLLILLCLSFLSLFLLTEFSPGCRSDFHAVFLSSNFFFSFWMLGVQFYQVPNPLTFNHFISKRDKLSFKEEETVKTAPVFTGRLPVARLRLVS